MECGAITSSKGIDSSQAEIVVLSKVQHRHLVSLLGYFIEGNEIPNVGECMPLGPLNIHLRLEVSHTSRPSLAILVSLLEIGLVGNNVVD